MMQESSKTIMPFVKSMEMLVGLVQFWACPYVFALSVTLRSQRNNAVSSTTYLRFGGAYSPTIHTHLHGRCF